VTVTWVDQWAGPVGGGAPSPAVGSDSDVGGPVGGPGGRRGTLPSAGHDPADGRHDGDEEQDCAQAHRQRHQGHASSVLHMTDSSSILRFASPSYSTQHSCFAHNF
jgi:hypothetical protein